MLIFKELYNNQFNPLVNYYYFGNETIYLFIFPHGNESSSSYIEWEIIVIRP